jgi:hypothetical protein
MPKRQKVDAKMAELDRSGTLNPHPEADPINVVRIDLVAALGREIEVVVRADQEVAAAGVRGIGVVDSVVVRHVLIEHANAGLFLTPRFEHAVVVVHLTLGQFFLCGRNVIVEIEVAAKGRHPWKMPAHALLEWFNLQRGALETASSVTS